MVFHSISIHILSTRTIFLDSSSVNTGIVKVNVGETYIYIHDIWVIKIVCAEIFRVDKFVYGIVFFFGSMATHDGIDV